MTEIATSVFHPDAQGRAAVAQILARGGLAAFPTETVYGLGADARNGVACAGIYAAKGRPAFNPLIVHVADRAMAEAHVEFTESAARLAAAFWPGPLTLVLRAKSGSDIAPIVRAGLETLAIRVPAHPVARGLLAEFGGPVAAPSANPSGRISPTTAAHVLAGLSGRIDAVLDGGACEVGLESTIIECTDTPVLLREGGVPAEAIEACLGGVLARNETPKSPTAPGQMTSHYAPRGVVRLNALEAREGEVLIGFGAVKAALTLSEAGDLREAAARLFEVLHQLDQDGAARIAVAPIPDAGLGRAINDRLRRAAAPRGERRAPAGTA